LVVRLSADEVVLPGVLPQRRLYSDQVHSIPDVMRVDFSASCTDGLASAHGLACQLRSVSWRMVRWPFLPILLE